MHAIKLASIAVSVFCAGLDVPAHAQAYPSKPVQVVLGLAPGSLMDSSARIVSKKASQLAGVQFVVENKAGAGTMIASSFVAKARPDGYTLLLNGVALSVNPSLYKEVPYDATRDFVPVAFLVNAPQILAAHPSLGVATVAEFLAKYKSSAKLNFAHPGAGTMPHLAAGLFQSRSGIKMQLVPYKGGAPALADLIAGHVDLLFLTPVFKPQIDSGAIRALAIASDERVETLPNVPTFAEAGLPMTEISAGAWIGILAPRGTPEAIVQKLNQTFNGVLQDAGVREEFKRIGQVPRAMTPEQFGAFMQEDMKRWPGIVAAAGIKAQ
jgi:tripartite-type tricarboxylate transporter receptor subunit TctC